MPNPLIEFSQTILKLNKEKNFTETLKYFKENKSKFAFEDIRSNSFIVSAMVNALRHTKNVSKGFTFLEIHNITISEATDEKILSAYGWLLYDRYKSENQNIEQQDIENESSEESDYYDNNTNILLGKSATVKLIEALIPILLKNESDFNYLLVSKLFNLVLKIEKRKAHWKVLSEFCDVIPPDRLRTDCDAVEVERKGETNKMELASDRENWYAYKSKALLKLEKYQACQEISSEALDLFKKFHYSNDIWLEMSIALSKKQLGNSEGAISDIQRILKKKKEWFIEKELAELYRLKEDYDSAFQFAIQAINNFGDLEYKVDLLFLMAELLKTKNETELSFKHYSLSRLIRIKKEWTVPLKLSSAIDSFKRENIPVEKAQELKVELKGYWNSFVPRQQNDRGKQNREKMVLHGKIDNILHNDAKGADGFIKYEGGKSVYFKLDANSEVKSQLIRGLEVEFTFIPEKDGKKSKAIHISLKKKQEKIRN